MVKTIIVLIVAAVGLFEVIHASDLILGFRLPGDQVLHSQVHFAADEPGIHQIHYIQGSAPTNITAVRAWDRSVNRTGQVSVHSGGIGTQSIWIMIQGYREGIGYDYLVEIFGL